jgi:hypothetical protein
MLINGQWFMAREEAGDMAGGDVGVESVESVVEEGSEESELEGVSAESVQDMEEELHKEELIRQLRLKIDGEEIVEDLPFDVTPEQAEYLRNKLQLANVSQKRMQETASLRKQQQELESEISEFFSTLKEDPEAILSDERFGLDLEKMAQRVLQKKLEQAAKSPEEIEREKIQSERDELRKRLEEVEKSKQEAKQREIEDKYAKELNDGIVGAIESNGLPKDAKIVARFAQAMRAGAKYNVNLTAEEIAPLIKEQLYSEAKELLSSFSDDDLEDFIGKDKIKNIRKRTIARLKKQVPSKNTIKDTAPDKSPDPFAKKKKRTSNSKKFFNNLISEFDK